MDICTMELSAFLFLVILISLTANIGAFLYSFCVRFLRYILYGQELHVKKQKILVPDKNLNSNLQREKLHEMAPKETLDIGLHISRTSTLPNQDFSSTKNLLAGDTPTMGFTFTSCSTEADDTHSFLQGASSETSEDLVKLLQEPETSLESFTKENGKGFEREKLYEIASKVTLGNGLDILQTSTLPNQGFFSTKNLLTKATPATGFTITSFSTETNNTHSFLQNLSSEDLTKALREPKTSLYSFTKENGKGFGREKLYEIVSKVTLGNGLDILQTSTLPNQDFSSTKNLLTKATPARGLTITSFSTETNDTHSFLQDLSSEDLTKALQEPKTSLDSFTKENVKGFEIPVTLTGLSENEYQNHSVMELPVDTQPISAVAGNMSYGEISSKSTEVVQFSLDSLESSVVAISTFPCSAKARTYNDSLQVGTNHTELVVGAFQACHVKEKLSVEVGYSSQNVSSRYMIPELIAEASDHEGAAGGIIKELEIDEISPIKQSSLSTVPMEFIYPCLPYSNP